MKKKLPIGMPIIEQRRDIRTVEVNGEKFEFDVSWGGNFTFDLAIVLALISLNDPRISKVFHEFQIEIKDRNDKILKC